MTDDTFKGFALDQLRALPELRAKAMFGGHGLYSGAYFFGILSEGQLYFKVDETIRTAYAKRGMKPFTYTKAKKVMTMNYYEVPPEILEVTELAVTWAKQSIRLAAAIAGKKRGQLMKSHRAGKRLCANAPEHFFADRSIKKCFADSDKPRDQSITNHRSAASQRGEGAKA